MNEQFTIGQVIAFLAIILGGAIGVYLVIILYRLSETMKKINALLEVNRENIDNTLNSIPGIVQNVNEITGSIRKKTSLLDGIFNDKEDTDPKADFSGIEGIISSITSLLGLFSEIKDFFGGKKNSILKTKKR